MVNGLFTPGETPISYCAFGIFRNRKIFSQDADIFQQERWFENSLEKTREQTLELVSSFGKYKYLGQNVALMELNEAFVEVSIEEFLGEGMVLTCA